MWLFHARPWWSAALPAGAPAQNACPSCLYGSLLEKPALPTQGSLPGSLQTPWLSNRTLHRPVGSIAREQFSAASMVPGREPEPLWWLLRQTEDLLRLLLVKAG